MHRFFLTDRSIVCGEAIELEAIRHQLYRVLRMRPGDAIVLLDGTGREYAAELQQIDERRAVAVVLHEGVATGEPRVRMTLYQCVLKGDKMEWVLQKGTELGVTRFVPVVSDRTVARPASSNARKVERWRAIVREAAEQSGRGLLPKLTDVMAWEDALGDADGLRIVPWEQADVPQSLSEAVDRRLLMNSERPQVNLLIGPEGGLTEREIQRAVERGWRQVTLGPRILRSETAAIAAISIVMAVLGEMD